jgi:hypothetical protein
VLLITGLHERAVTINKTVLPLSVTECLKCNNSTMEMRTPQGLFVQAYIYIYIYIYINLKLKMKYICFKIEIF